MAQSNEEYEKLRDKCIDAFKLLYNYSVTFDYCEVPDETRIVLSNDKYFIMKTRAIKAGLYVEHLETLKDVLAGSFANPEKPSDMSGTILKALEMQQKLIFVDLNDNKDDSNALNVTYSAMSREDFEAMETVEINDGGNSVELGADFGASEDNDSFEARMKAKTQEKLKELEDNKEVNDGTAG